MINLYLEYGMSKQLRERSLQSYEQTLRLFAAWIREQGVSEIEEIKDATIRKYKQTEKRHEEGAFCAGNEGKD